MTFFENIEFKRLYYYLYNTMKDNCITNMYLSKRKIFLFVNSSAQSRKGEFPLSCLTLRHK